jgi:hypothetical protein
MSIRTNLRIRLQLGSFRPGLRASMAPAMPGFGERPTAARMVRRHQPRREDRASSRETRANFTSRNRALARWFWRGV